MAIPENNFSEAEQFEAFFNSATIGIVLTDRRGAIINFNQYASQQFGYAKEEVLGKSIEVLIPQKFRDNHHKYREGFYRNPGTRAMGGGRDLFALRKDGIEFPVEISLSTYGSGDNLYAIAFIIDITVRKNNELTVLHQKEALEKSTEQIRRMNADLEEKVEARTKMLKETLAELEHSRKELSEALQKEKELGDLKSGFVTMASHEFRTPLSTILSSAFLLEQYNPADGENEKRARHLKRIKSSVEGLKSILEDFLSLGKLEDGSVQAHMELIPFSDTAELIENIIADMRQAAAASQILQLTSEGSSNTWADPALLRNILINLISNSLKFSPGESKITVHVKAAPDGTSITVSDNGIGISEEDQAHLFERFFRAKNASNIQGTGLGLNIVTKYLELMNGSISLQSRLNEGTTITIHLPLTDQS
jgi:PAS domain S-box-containing protein